MRPRQTESQTMTSLQIAAYLAMALVYATLITGCVALVLRLAGRRIGRGGLLLLLSTLFMVTLALYPLSLIHISEPTRPY